MNIFRSLRYFSRSIFILLPLFISSCQGKIDEQKQWEPIETPKLSPTDQRTVLVEEFTGQECVNCPAAANELSRIRTLFPQKIVTLSLHARDAMGQTSEALSSPLSNELAQSYRLNRQLPQIVINRQPNILGNKAPNRIYWETAIQQLVNTPASYRIEMTALPQPNGKWKIKAGIQHLPNRQRIDGLKLQLLVAEDVVDRQYFPDRIEAKYHHHNVLRYSLNAEGQSITEEQPIELNTPLEHLADPTANSTKIIALLISPAGEVAEAMEYALGKENGTNPDTVKPINPNQVSPKDALQFVIKGRAYLSGETITTEEVDPYLGDGTNMIHIKPILIYPSAQQPQGNYTISCRVETNPSELKEGEGLHQICWQGQCISLTPEQRLGYSEEFNLKSKPNLEDGDGIFVHTQINEKGKSIRVRLALLRDGKEVSYLRLLFIRPSK